MPARKTRLQLGRAVGIPESPDKAVLDAVPNPHTDTNYVVRFTAPEFTITAFAPALIPSTNGGRKYSRR